MSPAKVSWVIVASYVSHNLAIDLNMPLYDERNVGKTDEEEMLGLHARPTRNTTQKDAELHLLGHI
jgi:hypothetical protein